MTILAIYLEKNRYKTSLLYINIRIDKIVYQNLNTFILDFCIAIYYFNWL